MEKLNRKDLISISELSIEEVQLILNETEALKEGSGEIRIILQEKHLL